MGHDVAEIGTRLAGGAAAAAEVVDASAGDVPFAGTDGDTSVGGVIGVTGDIAVGSMGNGGITWAAAADGGSGNDDNGIIAGDDA